MSSDETANSSASPSTPSPLATGAAITALRRPARKSTLTQQQRNQKRQRATQDQLITLEVEFNKNPTPTAAVRERIAQEINMTERSVQIWFQNRRAKIKLLAKKSIETGEECDAIPDSMRQYLAMQAGESGKPLAHTLPIRPGPGMSPFGDAEMAMGAEASGSSKVVIHHFACRALSIGSWRRIGQNAMDLVVFYSPDKACITYYINNDSAGYKIEYPFACVRNITLDPGELGANGQPIAQRPGGLVIELSRPPNFFMDSSGSGGFFQCGDFTEDQQASHVLVHHLGGHPKVLGNQLNKLVSLDAFQHRPGLFPPAVVCVSAPVSPELHRPASQPNHVRHPHLTALKEGHFGSHLHAPRTHKRQRSRSVPLAVDFAALHHHHHHHHPPSMSPFAFHSPHEHALHSPGPTTIYAPVPQHQTPPSVFGGALSALRIDTSSGFGMEMQPYPLSAATTASPSDYASPALYASAPSSEPHPALVNPYALPFMSPSLHPSGLVGAGPRSAMSGGDPVIANQSPPLTALDRSAAAELFHLPEDASMLTDDGMSLTELYSKQSLGMSMPSPGMAMDTTAQEELAMSSMISFDSIDAASLSPEDLR
ncbi:MAG: hypothetical protein M1826_002482 [Phylliscum demangeonii]|nr:MAG: hypothetical protein M1826_002482 [Phylliscum demangeonii]